MVPLSTGMLFVPPIYDWLTTISELYFFFFCIIYCSSSLTVQVVFFSYSFVLEIFTDTFQKLSFFQADGFFFDTSVGKKKKKIKNLTKLSFCSSQPFWDHLEGFGPIGRQKNWEKTEFLFPNSQKTEILFSKTQFFFSFFTLCWSKKAICSKN